MCIKFIEYVLCVLCLFVLNIQLTFSQNANSKIKNTQSIITEKLSTQFLTVVSDVESGRFSLTDANNINLLYNHPEGLTSYINVYIDGKIYTSNSLHGPQTPPFTRSLPHPTFTRFADRLQYEWQIPILDGGMIQIIQELIPRYDTSLEAALMRMRLTIKNLDLLPHSCGILTVFDMMLAQDDAPIISVDSVDKSSEISINPVSKRWDARSTSTSRATFGVFTGLPELTIPDYFVIGRWQYDGYLGAVAWNYIASNLSLKFDNAVLIGWNEKILQPNVAISYTTDYGYPVPIESAIFCVAPKKLILCEGGKDYNPNPFPVAVQVFNCSSVPINNLKATISLPSRAFLVSGSKTQSILPQPLLPGMTTTVIFMVKVNPMLSVDTLHIDIEIQSDFEIKNCGVDIQIPSTRVTNYSVILPKQIKSNFSTKKYEPFDIYIPVTNNLCTSLTDVRVTLSLPLNSRLVNCTNPAIIQTIPSQFTNVTKFKIELTAFSRDTVLELPLTIKNEYEEIKESVFLTMPSNVDPLSNVQKLLDEEIQFEVFPNVFRNIVSVIIHSSSSLDGRLYLKDLYGRTFWDRNISLTQNENIQYDIVTNDLIPGLYFLFLETEKYIVVRKVLRL